MTDSHPALGPPPRLVVVRHAETEWSASGRHTGRTDVPLTETGRRRAAALAPALSDWSFAAVFTSPLSRARETCELAGLGDRAQPLDALMEWDYGDYEGLTTAQIREQRPDWSLWRDGCPNGEHADQVGARADAAIEQARSVGGDVALFSHGHMLRVLAARWIWLDTEYGARLALSTASIGVLGHERETAVVWRWNDTSATDGV